MLDVALILLRIVQYAGASVLFGASLFLLYALPRGGDLAPPGMVWPRPLLLAAAVLTLAGAALGLIVQTGAMAGSFFQGFEPATLASVAGGTGLGRAAIVRSLAAAAALVALMLIPRGQLLWGIAAALGAVATASWAWMGHGAASEGPAAHIHLGADIFHSLAAGLWLGALPSFLLLLWRPALIGASAARMLYRSLEGFGLIGVTAVAVLVITGLVNSWFLVGPDGVWTLWSSAYGRLLSAKLLLFALMLALAAANRYRLSPLLDAALTTGGAPGAALATLRRSVTVETGSGLGILTLVAWLGTLSPVSAG